MCPFWLSRRQCCPEGTYRQYLGTLKQPLSEYDTKICPPLIVAARNGFEKILSIILKSDPKPNIEMETTLHFKGYNDIEGVTALWCAADCCCIFGTVLLESDGGGKNVGDFVLKCIGLFGNVWRSRIIMKYTIKLLHYVIFNVVLCNYLYQTAMLFSGHVTDFPAVAGAGHFETVKRLVESGADVNHATKTNSTPIHVACYSGKLEIVKFLHEHGADIHILENHGHSCLMAATCGGHMDVFFYLLDEGVDLNQKMLCGNTAMHLAAECGNGNILFVLLQMRAVSVKNANGLSPLLGTARSTLAYMLEYLITLPAFSKEDKILSLELLGASFASDMYYYNLPNAYKYMRLSMEMRFNDPEAPLPKVIGQPLAAYGNWVECQSLEDLERIRHDTTALHMESLAVRERILGQRHPEVADAVEFRGSVFAEEGRYDRTAELWLHALRIRQQNKVSVSNDLIRFAEMFHKMLSKNMDLKFSLVSDVFAACALELERNKETLATTSLRLHAECYLEEFQSNIIAALNILVTITKLLSCTTPNEKLSIHRLVYQLNKSEIRLQNGLTLLHLCVSENTSFDEKGIERAFIFPCAAVTHLLIKCGADVNSMDIKRDTPLHIIAAHRDGNRASSIISLLINAGAHTDVVNVLGETPFNTASTDAALDILHSQLPLSLKCLAAKVVMDYNIPFENEVPKMLIDFIDLHGKKH
ncbi:Protein fem-1 homolog B [Gryllus bimaculatus]|nr:Protein fem-1 homolog B [Gryllus bimaculatus]